MDSQAFAEWLASLSLSDRIRALALIYSQTTVYTRQLFWPDTQKGKEKVILNMLHGVNEIHHTLANYLLRYTHNEEDWPPQVLSQQLVEIADQYHIGDLLTTTVEFAQSRNCTRKT